MCRRYKGTNEFRDRTRARSCLGLIEQRRRKRAEQKLSVLAQGESGTRELREAIEGREREREREERMTRVNNVSRPIRTVRDKLFHYTPRIMYETSDHPLFSSSLFSASVRCELFLFSRVSRTLKPGAAVLVFSISMGLSCTRGSLSRGHGEALFTRR